MKKLGLAALGLLLVGVPSLLVLYKWPTPKSQKAGSGAGPAESWKAPPALDPRDAEFEDANRAASRPVVDLLRLPDARLVRSTALPGDADSLAHLTDDKPATVAEAAASADG